MTTLTPDIAMPHDLDAERAILGACLVRQSALDDLEGVLADADFYRAAHQTVYAALRRLAARGVARDLLTLSNELGGALEACGGPAYVSSLVDGLPSSTHVGHWASLVRDLARRRRLIEAGRELIQRATSDDETAEVLAGHAQALARLDTGGAHAWVSMHDLIGDFLDRVSQANGGPMHRGIPTGFRDLDEAVAGWHPGNLIYIAARPSMGKTAFLLQTATAAAEAGKRVGFVSLEMSKQELTDRLICQRGRVDMTRMHTGHLSERDFGALAQTAGVLDPLPILIDDDSSPTIEEVCARVRRMARTKGLDLLIVDFLQRLSESRARKGERVSGSRTESVGHQSRQLKSLAKELGCPVLVASQLSRKCEDRADKRPMLSDLRESGDLEQDADLVIGLHRERMAQPTRQDMEDVADLLVLKHRNGPIGVVQLCYIASQTRFGDLA